MYRKCPSQRPQQQKAEKNRVCSLAIVAVRHALDGKGQVVPLFLESEY